MKLLARIWQGVKSVFARYEGAQWNPERSHIPAAYQSVRFDADAHSRSELARRMRYFERNNPLVQALAGKFENFVVGANPQLTPNSSDPKWNQRAKEWWDQWCSMCDIASRQGFGTILSLIARRWFIEGDVFIVLTSGREERGKRPRIQIIESHLCRTPPEFERDPMVHDGVRFDDFGRPTFYYFATEAERGKYVWGEPTAADNVIPVFEPERPGELRGITHFHSCVNELHDLDDLHILEMRAARDAAEKSTIVTTASGEFRPQDLRVERINGTSQNSAGDEITVARSEFVRSALGGRAIALKKGETCQQFVPARPSVVTVEYWKLKRELVCAAVEIPYCIVFPDSMQGTVYRGALDMATAYFKSRHAVIADVERRIWNYVMGWATKSEKGLQDPPADWRNVSILPPRAPNVDVGRNSAAMLQELADGASNFDLIYGPLGLSWQIELRKKAQQAKFIRELAKEYGVDISEISQTQQDKAERIQTEPQIPVDPETGKVPEKEEGGEVPIKRKESR